MVSHRLANAFGILFLLAALFCLYFFRDFDRNTTLDESAIYSPGDGHVMSIDAIQDGPMASGFVVRIFLSVLDGHVQRSPVTGTVKKIVYQKGRFLDARDLRAHVENEQNSLTIVSNQGELVVKQIAGLIARRIVCWSKEGDQIKQGERFGLIRFGSQADVLMPSHTEVVVKVGDKVVGGETLIARWKNKGA
jgi:phosphatidylserine decarboxylase